MSLATILNTRRNRNGTLAMELVGLSEKKRKGFNDMKRLYQVETKEKHKMKKLLIKKETNKNRRMKKPNKGVVKVMSTEETTEKRERKRKTINRGHNCTYFTVICWV
jgi:hypothetical protein